MAELELEYDPAPRKASQEPNTPHTSHPEPNRAIPSHALRTGRAFSPRASIVLIGIRGTGKSSLAVIACTALGRRLIDADQYFLRTTGASRASFRKARGITEYRIREVEVMKSMLMDNERDCIIACGPGCLEESGQPLLQEYAKTHPVIHILRDVESIRDYLRIESEEKIRRLLDFCEPMYRACSNLEFYNMSEEVTKSSSHSPYAVPEVFPGRRSSITPSLTLKHAEQVFVRFINFVVGHVDHVPSELHDPRSEDSTRYTYALSVNLSTLLSRSLDMEELESGVDALELRIDLPTTAGDNRRSNSSILTSISAQLAFLRRNITVPIIYHVETIPALPDETYFELVHHGLRLGAEYVTVDTQRTDKSIRELLVVKGLTKLIGSLYVHTPGQGAWDKEDRLELYTRARALGCDIVRISQPAHSMEDNVAVQRFVHRIETFPMPHPPIVAYNTGLKGRHSCCFNRILTPVTHPALQYNRNSDFLPCITAREAQEALYKSFVLDRMHFYIFGANVLYSLSPAMHNAAYAACGMPHIYSIKQAPSLGELEVLVKSPDFGGASIALPYKTQIMARLSSESSHARAIGAVNTVIAMRTLADGAMSTEMILRCQRNRAGPVVALHGDNTDWIGMRTCVRRNLSPANAITPRTVSLIIGAGGMARAAIYAMVQLGVRNVLLYNRTIQKAESLAHHYNSQTVADNSTDLSSVSLSDGKTPDATTASNLAPLPRSLVTVLKSLHEPWPADLRQPTIIVCCIPAHSIGSNAAPNFTVPKQWLESPTGGVVLEVSPSLILGFFC